MKKILNQIKRFFLGLNPAGQLLYGVLDFVPGPQIHNIVREAIHKKELRGKEAILYVWDTLDKPRLSLTIVLSVSYAKGWLTLETLDKWLDILIKIRPYVEKILQSLS